MMVPGCSKFGTCNLLGDHQSLSGSIALLIDVTNQLFLMNLYWFLVIFVTYF